MGFGIPLAGVALISGLTSNEAPQPATDEPVLMATDSAPPAIEEIDAADIIEDVLEPAPPPEPEYDKLTLKVGRGDTMEKMFRRNDLDVGELFEIARLEAAKKQFRRIKPGDLFEVEHDNGSIVSLYAKLNLTSALQVTRSEDGFAAEIVERPIEVRKRFAYGVIESSLFESAAQAGLSDKTIMNVAGIFAWDVDFILDIREGDNYYVQFEEVWQDGEYVTDGEIIAAEFNNNGRQIQAIRFKDKDNNTDYFTPTGDSVRKAFILSLIHI